MNTGQPHTGAATLHDYIEIPNDLPSVNTALLQILGESSVEIDVAAKHALAPTITFYSSNGAVPLERVLQLLASFDLSITDQRTTTLERRDGLICHIHQFTTASRALHRDPALGPVTATLTEAVSAMWAGWTELDRFAVLVLTAGLEWREVAVLRAYGRYLRQTDLPHSLYRIQAILLSQPRTARALVELFHAQFDPSLADDSDRRTQLAADRLAEVDAQLDRTRNLDADRVIRAYRGLITATMRTNYFRDKGIGPQRRHLSFKFVSSLIEELPGGRCLGAQRSV